MLHDLISDGTSLLDLVEILEDHKFSFVLRHREIAGYAHFSELNHHVVKLAFYVILEALERQALGSAHSGDPKMAIATSYGCGAAGKR